MINDKRIDSGKPFDWGRTSSDYARYRDIYPQEFYDRITELGLCKSGQRVLDLGTGTGVLPRNMYSCGADWTACDISPEQIEQARRLAGESGMKIDFRAESTEQLDFPEGSFDVITACQCFWYFDHKTVAPRLFKWLRPDGRLLILYMAWLPFEDEIAGASERLVLKYSPEWSGAGETLHPIGIPGPVLQYFEPEYHDEYRLDVPFTRESWHGRMRSCRGVGASLTPEEIASWEKEHLALLERLAPESFSIRHYAALSLLRKKQI